MCWVISLNSKPLFNKHFAYHICFYNELLVSGHTYLSKGNSQNVTSLIFKQKIVSSFQSFINSSDETSRMATLFLKAM